MQISETDSSTKPTSITTPFRVRRYNNFPTLILVAIVDVQFQLLAFMSLYQREQIFALMENGISSDNIIAEGA